LKGYFKWRAGSISINDPAINMVMQQYNQVKLIRLARKKDTTYAKKALSQKEIKTLLKELYYNGADTLVIDGVILHLYFGARAVELASSLASAKIQWNRRDMQLPSAKRSGGEKRFLHWHEDITPYFERWYSHVPLPYPSWWLTSRLKGYKAGAMKITTHTFRRTFETNMRLMEVDQRTIDLIMGHKQPPTMGNLYMDFNLWKDRIRATMEEEHYLLDGGILYYLESLKPRPKSK
jgi:integrase